ncbi:hypothetical protein COE79_20695 [Bacillus toyonensis]|uniref:hypothetical protein n=1 Tax=Bacillus toyonensis TaxID=155322 RepID=UPI000BFDB806|nr:hypothetical protein [Bacillus toyonensis]PHA98711.1 hypothetical protein COE79_20695 [Bacillus toyonensis]
MKYTLCIGEFTETYEGTVEEIIHLKKSIQIDESVDIPAEKKSNPRLDELSKGLRTFSSHYGYIPDSIKMNPIYFAELVIENKNLSMIQQIDISNIRFQGIPVNMDASIVDYKFI